MRLSRTYPKRGERTIIDIILNKTTQEDIIEQCGCRQRVGGGIHLQGCPFGELYCNNMNMEFGTNNCEDNIQDFDENCWYPEGCCYANGKLNKKEPHLTAGKAMGGLKELLQQREMLIRGLVEDNKEYLKNEVDKIDKILWGYYGKSWNPIDKPESISSSTNYGVNGHDSDIIDIPIHGPY